MSRDRPAPRSCATRVVSIRNIATSSRSYCALALRHRASGERASRGLVVHESVEVRLDRTCQALEVVAAFEKRYDAAAGVAVGEVHELRRGPAEVGLGQHDVGERIAHMRVEARRDDDEVGAEILETRQIADSSARESSLPLPGAWGALTMVCDRRARTGRQCPG